jgi:hypothetical protein
MAELEIDVLIPTIRGDSIAPVLLGLTTQTLQPRRVIVGDQGNKARTSALVRHLALRLDVEVVKVAATDVTANRLELAARSTAPYLYWSDDDNWARPDVLALLAAGLVGCGVALAQARVTEVVPLWQPSPESWRLLGTSGHIRRVAWCEGGATLCTRESFETVEHYTPADKRGGEDIVWTAQAAVRWGAVQVGAAEVLHLRAERSPWLSQEPDNAWLRERVKPTMSDQEWDKFTKLMRGYNAN